MQKSREEGEKMLTAYIVQDFHSPLFFYALPCALVVFARFSLSMWGTACFCQWRTERIKDPVQKHMQRLVEGWCLFDYGADWSVF